MNIGSGQLVKDASGNVGVGTATVGARFHVVTGASPQALIERTSSTVNTNIEYKNTSGSIFAGHGSANTFVIGNSNNLTLASATFARYSTDLVSLFTSGSERMRIDSSGNVGIGTSSPAALLNVSGSATTAKTIIQNTGTGATTFNGSGAGLELLAGAMNTSSKYTPAIKFGSTDPDFTTTNPKFGAAITAEAMQVYSSDTTGGMDLAFWTAPISPGTGSGLAERMRIDNSGRVAIGATPFAGNAFFVRPNFEPGSNGNQIAIGPFITGTMASARGFLSSVGATAAASANNLQHFYANQSSFASGAVITNQFGFSAESTLTGATNNYGFHSNIAAGTGRWNFYAAGSATNYFAGQVLLGSTAAASVSTVTPTFQNLGTGVTSSSILLGAWNTDNGVRADINLVKSGGSTIGTFTAVENNEPLGFMRYWGADGTVFVEAARITSSVDGTPGTNDMPGRLIFSTTPTGSASPTERMRIDSSGRVGINKVPDSLYQLDIVGQQRIVGNAASIPAFYLENVSTNTAAIALQVVGGLNISRTAVTGTPAVSAGNVFSGTYTPTLTNSAGVAASTATACQYMRVGNVVTVSGQISSIETTGTGTQTIGITLPVASSFAATRNCSGTGEFITIAFNNTSAGIFGDTTNNRATLRFVSPSGTTGQTVVFHFTYVVA
jgi:hypothetical protein